MKNKAINKTGPAGLFVIITLVNAGNYLLNIGLGRFLGPEAFSEAGVLSVMVLILSFVAMGLQVAAAQFTAQQKADHPERELSGFLTWSIKAALIAGGVLSLLVAAFGTTIQSFLHFRHVAPILLLAPGIPVYFVMSVQRGYLQGQQDFKPFTASYVAEMAGRLAVTALLAAVVYFMGLDLMSEAVALGFTASFLTGCLASTPKIKKRANFEADRAFLKVILRLFLVLMIYEFTQIVISYSDTLLVKHYHDAETAGWYTALSLIGRIVYFATWSVVMLLIPKVIELERKGQAHEALFMKYFAFVAGLGLLVTGLCFLLPELIVVVLFGKAYLPVAAVLWKYAAATTLFASANLFTYYYMSREKYLPVALTGLAGLAQIVLVRMFHQSIVQIVHAQILVMSVLLFSLFLLHLINKKYYEKTEDRYRIAVPAQ